MPRLFLNYILKQQENNKKTFRKQQDLARKYQIPFSSFGLVSLAFWGSLCITECIQGQVEGSFCLSGYKKMQNSEFRYRLQWFISFLAYFCHLIWNIGSGVMCFLLAHSDLLVNTTIKSIAKKIYYDVHEQKMMKVFKKTQSNNERCIRLALFKSAQDDKDHIGSQTRR